MFVHIFFIQKYNLLGDFMRFLKCYGLGFLFSFGFLLFLTFVLTFFSYINFINDGWFVFFMIFNLFFSLFISGFVIGKGSIKKGYLEGIKFGLLFYFFICLVDFILFGCKFNMKFVIFGLIIVFSSMFGGMVGILFKKK